MEASHARGLETGWKEESSAKAGGIWSGARREAEGSQIQPTAPGVAAGAATAPSGRERVREAESAGAFESVRVGRSGSLEMEMGDSELPERMESRG